MGRVNTRKPRRKTTKRTTRSTTPSAPAPPSARLAGALSTDAGSGIISPWGRVDEEYALIKADLKRLAWVTSLLMLVLVVLTYFLR